MDIGIIIIIILLVFVSIPALITVFGLFLVLFKYINNLK